MSKYIYAIAMSLIIFSCTKYEEKDNQKEEIIDSIPFIIENNKIMNIKSEETIGSDIIAKKEDEISEISSSETYFIYEFWNNPFLDNQIEIDYFGKNIDVLLKNEAHSLIINKVKIENPEWTNGYYYKTEIKNGDFEAYYLSPFDKDSFRRPLLVIYGNNHPLKSNIYIGMKKNELLPIIENNDDESYVSYEGNRITVAIETIWVFFDFENEILIKVEIQVGT